MVKVGLPLASSGAVFTLVSIAEGRAASACGEHHLAGTGSLGRRLEAVAFTVCEGFRLACATLVGQWLGYGDARRAREAHAVSSAMCVVAMAPFAVALFFFGRRWLAIRRRPGGRRRGGDVPAVEQRGAALLGRGGRRRGRLHGRREHRAGAGVRGGVQRREGAAGDALATGVGDPRRVGRRRVHAGREGRAEAVVLRREGDEKHRGTRGGETAEGRGRGGDRDASASARVKERSLELFRLFREIRRGAGTRSLAASVVFARGEGAASPSPTAAPGPGAVRSSSSVQLVRGIGRRILPNLRLEASLRARGRGGEMDEKEPQVLRGRLQKRDDATRRCG